MAINHNAFPQPKDQGFDWSRNDLGITRSMSPSRIDNFATNKKNDKFKLDANGFPYHANSENALTFIKESKEEPFFLFYATWLVHTPIHTRSEQLLKKIL